MIKLYQNRDWLYQKYIVEGLSTYEIAKICKVSGSCIGRRLKRYNIKIRSYSECQKGLQAGKKNPMYDIHRIGIENSFYGKHHSEKSKDKMSISKLKNKLAIKYKNKIWLEQKYINEIKSIREIASIYNVGMSTIKRWLEKYNIQVRSSGEGMHIRKGNNCDLSQEAIEWINGELLGDGCLRNRHNWSAGVNYSSKHFEYINYISDTLEPFGIKQSGKIRKIFMDYKYKYILYTYKSCDYEELLPIYKKWYPEGKKIIPKDIKLTPLTCRQWYIGDGCLINGKNRNPHISLATCGFIISDVEYLIKQLNELGFKATRWKASNNIGITTNSTKDFLEYIGDCSVSCYQYKWNYIKYEKEHILQLYEDRDWMYQKYVIEEIPGAKIGILCGVTSRPIYNWLIKFNIIRRSNSETHKGPKIERICKTCGKKFYVTPSKANQKYHSRECQLKQYIGINNPNYRRGKYVKQGSLWGI
ncbi:hypothetical protein ES695_09260 [Candidatus Atribacteria bacterium 1244-E10-H5-B2]|nr:MAG: hypothetical protein ES695_09260 [Candidatus Atribacteria bacterium 1244-E10-H5-B2]